MLFTKFLKRIFILLFCFNSIKVSCENAFLNYVSLSKYCDKICIPWRNVYFDPKTVKPGDIVYISAPWFPGKGKNDNGNCLSFYFKNIHPSIKSPYILVSHCSDCDTPGKCVSDLNDPKIIMCFGQNPNIKKNSKFYPIPLGLCLEPKIVGNISPENLTQILTDLKNNKKERLLYMNFNIRSYPQERTKIFDFFSNKEFCFVGEKKPYFEFLKELASFKFVISPRGQGLDCYRNWEALCVGTIPIIKTSYQDPIFEELPVLIVNDWSEVTKEFLDKKYEEMSKKDYNLDKLYTKYWAERFYEVKQTFLRSLSGQ